MTQANSELKNIVEAALLVAGQPLAIERLLALFPEGSQPTREELRAALDELDREYAERGIELKQIDKGWRVQTREKYTPWVARLLEERPPRYSRALLETLAIIVYRQPVTRGEIEDIRGVSVSTDIIRTLIEREWIREVGRREVPGRPALYGTTRQFLEHFNLKSLEEMPPLAALRPIEEISAELESRVQPAALADVAAGEAPATAAETESEPEIERTVAPADRDGDNAPPTAEAAESEPEPAVVAQALPAERG
ncbi:MAG: SMC-Scp complex subunit ScpB [Candidatus Muproteobacteria bacterium RBG_16_65_34]|uniref:SMC-Scp complex subunit ScpB n=1 Tax=Candidatus Muproteobacteria bacterium RBG_16_65_34 TaxID=1817760 RepID=A0A1F6TM97_9PROT|nr:MAG: SMC-Scp complex subunit ScpB [Candidatus Muproteobacteria bacterium RBG_16_65_34]